LKRIGCDTGKAVLELSVDELARRAELNRDTAERVLNIIKTEFEEGPGLVQQLERGRFTVKAPSAESDNAEEESSEEAAVSAENGAAASPDAELVEEVEDDASPAEEETHEEEQEAKQ
jgi:N utilization substance protein A